MTPEDYTREAERFDNHRVLDIETAYALGLCAEAGEVANLFERARRYGRHGVDTDLLRDELGDVLWNVSMLAKEYGWTLEDLMARNIAKLTTRYAERGLPVKEAS